VSWAAGNGDRSENGDYLYGKKRLREIDRRVRFLEQRLAIAEVVDPARQPNRDQVFFSVPPSPTSMSVMSSARSPSSASTEAELPARRRSACIRPSPARLLRARRGEMVKLQTPTGPEELEILEDPVRPIRKVDLPPPRDRSYGVRNRTSTGRKGKRHEAPPTFDFSGLLAKGIPETRGPFLRISKVQLVVGGQQTIPTQIPIEALTEAARSVLKREGSKLAMYNLSHGPQGLTAACAISWSTSHQAPRHHRHPRRHPITPGSGQGIELVSRCCLEPGDTVNLEEYCYGPAAIFSRAKQMGAKKIVSVPLRRRRHARRCVRSDPGRAEAKGRDPKYILTPSRPSRTPRAAS